jgi:hypothetical protein
MTFQNSRRLAPFLLLVVLAGGCGGVIDPSENQVENFSGTLAPGGRDSYPFTVGKNGEFDIKITALSNADAILHVLYGPESGGCNLAIIGDAYRQLNQGGFSGLIQPGRYCVYLWDDIGLRAPVTYTLTVSHP